jgi:hypothetical protein
MILLITSYYIFLNPCIMLKVEEEEYEMSVDIYLSSALLNSIINFLFHYRKDKTFP